MGALSAGNDVVTTLEKFKLRFGDGPIAAFFVDAEVVHLERAEILGEVVLHHEYRLRKAHLARNIDVGRGNGALFLENQRIFSKRINVDHTLNINKKREVVCTTPHI